MNESNDQPTSQQTNHSLSTNSPTTFQPHFPFLLPLTPVLL